MTAELAPRPARAQPRPIDRLRKAELDRRVAAGQDEFEAWASIATDGRIGLGKYRNAPTIPVASCARTLANFKDRTAPGWVHEAAAAVETDAAAFGRSAFKVVRDIASGDFGQGVVRMKGSGENAQEVVEIDAAACGQRLAAARLALKIIGVGADKQTRTTIIGSQTNVAGSILAKLG